MAKDKVVLASARSSEPEKKQDWVRHFATLLVMYRTPVMIVMAAFTTFLGYFMITQLSLKVVLEEMISPGKTPVKLYEKFTPIFGGGNTALFEARVKKGTIYNKQFLENYSKLTNDIYYFDGTNRFSVQSIALKKTKDIEGKVGAIRIEAIMWPSVPQTADGLNAMRRALRNLYGGQLVSLDDKSAMIMADFKSEVRPLKVFNLTRQLKRKYETPNLKLNIVGRPVLLGWIEHYTLQMALIFLLSFVLIALTCWLYFRSAAGVIVPIMKAVLTTIWGFGFIAMCHYNVNPLMLLLPFFVFATILSHAVQIMSRFYEEYARLRDFDQALVETLSALLRPSFSAIVADAIGFSMLYLVAIPTLQVLAILCTVWLLSITVAITFSAAAFFVIPMPENLKSYGRETLQKFTRFIEIGGGARYVLLGAVVVIISTGFMAAKVIIGDPNPGTPILWQDSEFNQASESINSHFARLGTDTMQVYVEGAENSMLLPKVLRITEGLTRYLKHQVLEMGGAQTLVPIVREVNAVVNEGDPSYKYIPGSAEEVAMDVYFFSSRGDPNDMDTLIDKQWKTANLTFFLKDHRYDTLKRATETMKSYFTRMGGLTGVTFYYPGGQGGLDLATNEVVHRAHYETTLFVMLTIMLLVWITYRSFAAAIMLGGMLLLADFLSLAYMYIAAVGMTLNSLPIAAVGMGRGVDYGIYMFDRVKEEFEKCGSVALAVRRAIDTTGSAIIFTGLAMIIPLLPWYFVSSLRFQGQMGLLLAMILFWHVVGALVYLPAAILYFKPKSILGEAYTEAEIAQPDDEAMERVAVTD